MIATRLAGRALAAPGGSSAAISCAALRARQPLARLGALRSRGTLLVSAAKGFGASKTRKPKEDAVGGQGPKAKRTNVKAPTAAQQLLRGNTEAALQQFDELEKAKRAAQEDAEFQARLELIKAEATQKRAAGAVPSAAKQPGSGSATPQRAVFDAAPPEEDIYANPPSLLSTLQNQLQSDINDPALREAKIGPGQIGLAAGAVLFGLVFVLVSGGDFATTNRYKGLRPSRPPPDPIEMSRLAQQAEGFEERVAQNPSDLTSLEAAAVTYARMQDYPKAAELLDKLTAARPDDVEAWRLLGESRLLNVESAKSVAAYERAIALRPDSQQLVTGLVDAYVADSQQGKAVSYLTSLRERLIASAAAAAAAPASSSSGGAGSSAKDAAATAAVLPGEAGAEGGGGGSSSASSSEAVAGAGVAAQPSTSGSDAGPSIDLPGVQLLLGKSYAAWRGHDQDALAAYDTLIRAAPEDFRAYLAKGVFLRERGRQADAERMFLQAKFYAPDSMAAFVAARAGQAPDSEPLPDLE